MEKKALSPDLYAHFADPKLAREVGMFTQFQLIDLTSIQDAVIDKHASITLMEKLLQYSRPKTIDLFAKFKELFAILGDEFPKVLSTSMLLDQDYWRNLILYILIS